MNKRTVILKAIIALILLYAFIMTFVEMNGGRFPVHLLFHTLSNSSFVIKSVSESSKSDKNASHNTIFSFIGLSNDTLST